MTGLKFEIPNEWGKFINKIIYNLNSKDFKWYIPHDEVHLKEDFLFDNLYYDNESFQEVLNKEDYYIVHANIQVYNINDPIIEINNYDDFLKSKCLLYIIIIDSSFVALYSKDESILNEIKSNALNNNFKNIEDLNDTNSRINFKILW